MPRGSSRSRVKLAIEDDYKIKELKEVGLSVEDFNFMKDKFEAWSYDELYSNLKEVLAIPEREITYLKEERGLSFS
jgi:hypothetical protein